MSARGRHVMVLYSTFGWETSLALSVSSGLGGDEGGAGLQRPGQHGHTV